MNEETKTAESLFNTKNLDVHFPIEKDRNKIIDFAKELAKYHVKEALKSAYKKGKLTYNYFGDDRCPDYEIIESSIIDAYPDNNIK
jgi:hypothetical protein